MRRAAGLASRGAEKSAAARVTEVSQIGADYVLYESERVAVRAVVYA